MGTQVEDHWTDESVWPALLFAGWLFLCPKSVSCSGCQDLTRPDKKKYTTKEMVLNSYKFS